MTNERKQRLLCVIADDTGKYYYNGPLDGIWGPESQKAAERFMKDFSGDSAADNNVGVKEETTGSFWDEIEFFDREEFKCTCGGRGCNGFPVEPVERLVRNANEARRHFGNSAPVSSGVRCKLRNSELPGSADNSLHMRGKAMDFAIYGVSASRLAAYLRTLPDVDECYEIDSSYVHMGVEKYK